MLFIVVAQAAESAERAAGGIGALGLDVRGLVFQVINFAILLGVLHRFAYRPLLRVLEERRQTIEESLKSAADIKRVRQELESEKRSMVSEARREAETIVGRSEKEAQLIQGRAQAAGQQTADRLMTQAQAQIGQQLAAARAALKREVLGLVVTATERVLREKIDEKKDRALVEDAITQARRALQNRL